MFDPFDGISIFLRFNSGCVRQLVGFLTNGIELSDHSPEHVTVVLTLSVSSHDYSKELESSIQCPGDEFRPYHAIDLFIDGVNAIDYDFIFDELESMLCPGDTYKGFVGVLHKEKGSDFSSFFLPFSFLFVKSEEKEEILEPFHWKYIIFHYNTENVADLLDLIRITIKESRGTAEYLDIVLSLWGYDGGSSGSSGSSGGGGGGEAIKDRSFVRMYPELTKSNRGVGR